MLGRRIQLLAAALVCLSIRLGDATQSSERISQAVEVRFYKMSTSDWDSRQSSFQALVGAEAATYCSANSPTCGIDSGFLFTSGEVGFAGDAEEESKDLKISFYIDFPVIHTVFANSTTQYVVNSNAATTIVTNIRSSLEDTLGFEITYIGDEFYGISPDKKLNSILIPIAFIVLFVIIVIAVGLHMWNKRKEEREKKQKKKEERKKKSTRITPTSTTESELKPPRQRRSKRTKKEPNAYVYNNGKIPTLSLKAKSYDHWQVNEQAQNKHQVTTNTVSLNDMQPQPVYEEKVVARNNALPPLPVPNHEGEKTHDEEEEERRRAEKKAEKKRRKKEKRRRQKEMEEAEDDANGDVNEAFDESESEKSRQDPQGNVVPVDNV